MTLTVSTRDRILDAAEALILKHGFHATTLESVLADAGASKGAFFHHFASKEAMGVALVERYAERDAELLETLMESAEGQSDDPGEQLLAFLRSFEGSGDEMALNQPGCLFVSFIYERIPAASGTQDSIRESIELWRSRILEKLQAAAEDRPRLGDLDLNTLADQVFTTFEGAFILARATDDPSQLASQLAHTRRYFELLLERD